MSRFHAYTPFPNPGLHVWRKGTDTKLFLRPVAPPAGPGWAELEYEFEPGIANDVQFMLFDFDAAGQPRTWEKDEHQRVLPRAGGGFADDVWFVQDSARVLTADPRSASRDSVRVHLISRLRYRPSELFVWDLVTGTHRRVSAAGEDELGPVFDVGLTGPARSLFLFKFIRRVAPGAGFDAFEPDFANRLWSSRDGGEIWTHSEAAEVARAVPQKKTLRLHLRQELPQAARLHFWQDNSDFVADADGVPGPGSWTTFEAPLYTGLGYGFLFTNPDLPEADRWEHAEATRRVRLEQDEERWTLEGDRALFLQPPAPDRRIELAVAPPPPFSSLRGKLMAHVWVNRARAALHDAVHVDDQGRMTFTTFPDVVTSVKLFDEHGHWEHIERHALQAAAGVAGPSRHHVVPERPPVLATAPPAGQFADPPFSHPSTRRLRGRRRPALRRPRAGGGPSAADRRVDGLGAGPRRDALDARRDLLVGAGARGTGPRGPRDRQDYHGAAYALLLDDTERLQDPAAGWVRTSWNQDASRLVQSDGFPWSRSAVAAPGLGVPHGVSGARRRASPTATRPRRRSAGWRARSQEQAGYLHELGVTAILLMPVNEVGTQNSWGYDPAFFYAVENELSAGRMA